MPLDRNGYIFSHRAKNGRRAARRNLIESRALARRLMIEFGRPGEWSRHIARVRARLAKLSGR